MVYTIGYGNRQIADFLGILERNKVMALYDIRTYPASRWQPAYNSKAFSVSLNEIGIAYVHKKNLGGKDTELLDVNARMSDLQEIAAVSMETDVVIMCSELDFEKCHRKEVAIELARLGAMVVHIGKDGTPIKAEDRTPMQLELEAPEEVLSEGGDWKENASRIFDGLDVSEQTRKEYKQRIGRFLSYAEGKGFTPNLFLEYKRELAGREDYSVSTKNKYLICARIFLKEMVRVGMVPIDITNTTKGFSQSKLHKKDGMGEAEITMMVGKLREMPENAQNQRLRALFCLLAFQGLRQIEIVRLNVSDIDMSRKVAYVRGKGSDDKEPVYLHPETVRHLKSYLKANRIYEGAVFKSLGNRPSERLSTMTIKRELKAMLTEIGCDKTVHGFRHYYITTLLEKFDVRDVRKFSRHKSLEMLIVYDDEIDTFHKSQEVFNCFNQLGLNA